jgi:6-pyruvoyltetrahydropterin/6-carboxytetrahydropterin synthase
MGKRVAVYRKEHFCAAHRLHSLALSDAENADFYGPCNHPNFHGHNYELVVKVTGDVDERTGYVVDMKLLSGIINEHVIEKFDHKNLNLDTEEFKTLNPTAENIAMVIHGILERNLDGPYKIKVTLYETERNFVEYPAD